MLNYADIWTKAHTSILQFFFKVSYCEDQFTIYNPQFKNSSILISFISYSFTGFSWHLYPYWKSATGPSTYPYLRWRLHAAFQIYVCPWSALHSLSQDYRTFFRSQEFLFRGSRIIKEWRFLTPLIAIPLSKTAITNSRGANFVDNVDNLITSLTRMTSLSQSRQVKKKKNDLGYSARLALIQICKFI